jgi:aspartyl-tRNA(Asn)/glutamyl-tRNA(Gln) amidotransferase subunit A
MGDERLENGEDLRPGLLRLPGAFNTVGYPAISLPCGLTRSGLPIGLQMAARPFEELLLLRVAHAYEVSHRWRESRPRQGTENGSVP